MACRSSSRRANTNARYIAKRAARHGSNALRWISREGGAFTDTLARTFALHKTTYPVDPERCDEVSWSLASEIMNRLVNKEEYA
jgi:hypothetical protein